MRFLKAFLLCSLFFLALIAKAEELNRIEKKPGYNVYIYDAEKKQKGVIRFAHFIQNFDTPQGSEDRYYKSIKSGYLISCPDQTAAEISKEGTVAWDGKGRRVFSRKLLAESIQFLPITRGTTLYSVYYAICHDDF